MLLTGPGHKQIHKKMVSAEGYYIMGKNSFSAKNIRLTRHVKNRMRWRRISDEEMTSTIETPDRVDDEIGVKVAYKKIGDRLIIAPYVIEKNVRIVLSVKFKVMKEGDER
ncbi:MAG: hypothetical protein AB1742_03625 [bacterium]